MPAGLQQHSIPGSWAGCRHWPVRPTYAALHTGINRTKRFAVHAMSEAVSAGYTDVIVPELSCRFTWPHRGSGLLFARSTGVRVWEGSYALARYIARKRCQLMPPQGSQPDSKGAWPEQEWHWQDSQVVELGCGLALVSMVSAHLGAQVIATDGDLDVVNVARLNIKHNTLEGCTHAVRVAQLPWGNEQRLQQLALPLPVDAVLMSDVVYGSDPGVWQKLVQTLSSLAAPGTLLLQCETLRVGGQYEAYWAYLQQHGFSCQELELDQKCNPSGKCRLWRLHVPS